MHPATRAVRAGIATDTAFGAVVPPIHLSTNYSFEELGRPRQYDYTRSGNPTRQLLIEALTALEGGAGGVVTSTGMSAVALVLQVFGAGGLVVAAHDCYGGTRRVLDGLARLGFLSVRYADLTVNGELESFGDRPRLVWIETPSNPLLRITDIRDVARRGRAAGALIVVDNTFLSPALQRPLELGADLVVHSVTKYLNGHSDVVAGAVVAAGASHAEELTWWANCLGVSGAPFDAWLVLRGIRTLHARMACHLAGAEAVVALLDGHPAVKRVHYPGLPSHPGHLVARAQQSGFGALVSFELHGGQRTLRGFLGSLELFTLAESLGGVESLVAHPATMTHSAMTPEARAQAGISDRLLRLSVGIEHPADLVSDLRTGLDRAREIREARRAALVS
jgi:cystathionine gamma-synthase